MNVVGYCRVNVYFQPLGQRNKVGLNHFILHVFKYLLRNDTFDMAVGLLEEIFPVRKESFCIVDVPNIYTNYVFSRDNFAFSTYYCAISLPISHRRKTLTQASVQMGHQSK